MLHDKEKLEDVNVCISIIWKSLMHSVTYMKTLSVMVGSFHLSAVCMLYHSLAPKNSFYADYQKLIDHVLLLHRGLYLKKMHLLNVSPN